MRRNNPQHKAAGFSLVELMISMTLGLILTAGLSTLFLSTLKGNGDLAKTEQLENELHASMQLMIRDLRRAGSNGQPSPAPNFVNPFGLGSLGAYTGEAANSCIVFSYDLNNNGVLDTVSPNDERFGYRVQQGVVQLRNSGLGCTSAGWTNVTTSTMVNVTQLQFGVNTLADGDMTIQTVTITLTGQLKSDATITRSLTGAVRIRNDLWTPH